MVEGRTDSGKRSETVVMSSCEMQWCTDDGSPKHQDADSDFPAVTDSKE